MLVKVNTSLAGADFSYHFGEIVDRTEFSAKVGNGWQSLCEPVAPVETSVIETTDEPAAQETTVVEPVFETAVKPAPVETAVKRGRRR